MSFHRLAGFAILLISLMLNTTRSWANPWEHTFSTRFSTEYESNPAMSPAYPGSVWRGLFDPSYTLAKRQGQDEFRTGLALQMARSSNETLSQNRDSPSVFFDWLRLIDTGEFGITSRYEEVATRNSIIDATGQVPANSIRTSRTISGKWNQSLTARSNLSINGTYENVFYSDNALIDYAARSGNIRYAYAWSENNTPFIRLSFIDYEPILGASSRLDSSTLGWNWNTSDHLAVTLEGGKTSSSDGDTSSQGGAAVRYTGQRSNLTLNAHRQVAPSGLGGFITVNQANANWSYALSEHSRTGIDFMWQKNLTTDIINRTEGIWLQHDLDSFWAMRTYYTHNIYYGGVVKGAYSNILGISLIYTHTDF